MSSFNLQPEFRQFLLATANLDSNPLVQLAQRRALRQSRLLPGWKRNAWVFLVYPLALIIAVLISVSMRHASSWSQTLEAISNVGFGATVGVIAPLAILWLLAGLFRMCRDCLGWYSEIKDSGGGQMLDGLICMSPLDNHAVVLAGVRLYIVPMWPRIIALAVVFSLVVVMSMRMGSIDKVPQALWFAPLSIIAMSLSGILGSLCLGLYLFLIGVKLRLHLIIPLISLMIAGLQIVCLSFGGAFFGAISGSDAFDTDLWPLVIVGLAAGIGIFILSLRLAYAGQSRNTWLLVVLPLLIPVVISFFFLLSNILTMGMDEEPFIAVYGNLMWVYNAFMPFSPFSAPTVMLRGAELADAWRAMAFEPWRWPVLTMLQLLLISMLARAALTATSDRRTALD